MKKNEGPRVVRLPDGKLLTKADLPPVDTVRWVISRKAVVVYAVRFGLILQEQALAMYNISQDELESWGEAIDREGLKGLKATAVRGSRRSDGAGSDG